MANSLQEQLLKAGLVNEQQLKQTKTGKRKDRRQGTAPDHSAQEQARRAAAEKQARDREFNQKRDEEARRRAETVALWQLVREQRVSRDGGDIAYNFADGSALKRLHVTAEQQRGIVAGRLAIVRQDAFYEVVPAEVARRCADHDPTLVLVLNTPDSGGGDDEYADYKVPDDLIW